MPGKKKLFLQVYNSFDMNLCKVHPNATIVTKTKKQISEYVKDNM